MALNGYILTALCALWAGIFAQDAQIPSFRECPVDLFFVLDTSESVALRAKPPEFFINQIKTFTKLFIDQLKDLPQQCNRDVTWNSGALHYSDDTELVMGLVDLKTKRSELKAAIDKIKYIGKGTYTDCAIKEGISELLRAGTHYHENKYIVVVTDGHPVTGYKEPCGGVQEAANEARQHAIKVFAVAISPDQEDTRLSVIATDVNYRQNFTAADNSRSSQMTTINSIVNMIVSVVTQTHNNKDVYMIFLTLAYLQSHCLLFQGDRGPRGANGDKGERGDDGPPGPDGTGGERGTPGEKGEQGSRGNRGPRGILIYLNTFRNIIFPHFQQGELGRTGAPGYRGDEGPTGPEGAKGPRGIKGAPGDRGLMGERGEDGPPGNGTEGCHGFQGGKGTPGPKGDDGEPGDPGLDVSRFRCTCAHDYVSLSFLSFLIRFFIILSLRLVVQVFQCKCGPLDIAFIVDSSESIGASNFAIAKDFIVTVMDRLKLRQFGANESRIGVVQYSGASAQEVIQLGDPNIKTLTDLKQAVKDLRWLAEATYTGEALQYSLNNMINKLVTEKSVVIVLTDGRSDTLRDKVPLNVLCGKGLKVGGVGVTDYAERQPNPEQLDEVVCKDDPREGFSFVLNNFGLLLDDSFLQNLTEKICEDKKCPTYTCPISFIDNTDVLIMMDSSASVGSKNFEMTKDFAKMLAKRFLSAERGNFQVRVGVGQYSNNANIEAEFASNSTQVVAQIAEAKFQNAGTQVTNALNFAIERFRGGRTRKKKLLVFSDGRSQGVNINQIEKAVEQVSNAGIELYVLAAGNQVNEAHLRTLVSRGRPYDNTYAYHHLFKVPDYRSLVTGVFYQTVSRKISLE
uniref:Collagen alpha-1(VI) chain-like n=1 Tax=Sinocyclocheilus anshuiensis TaxID=1608454 RepID=A0A671S012_9TELE